MFEGLRTPTDVVVIVITLLAFGCPVQAIVRAYGLDERTVAAWRDRAGKQCQRVHQGIVEQGQLDLIHVQADNSGESTWHGGVDGLGDAGLDASVAGWGGESHS